MTQQPVNTRPQEKPQQPLPLPLQLPFTTQPPINARPQEKPQQPQPIERYQHTELESQDTNIAPQIYLEKYHLKEVPQIYNHVIDDDINDNHDDENNNDRDGNNNSKDIIKNDDFKRLQPKGDSKYQTTPYCSSKEDICHFRFDASDSCITEYDIPRSFIKHYPDTVFATYYSITEDADRSDIEIEIDQEAPPNIIYYYLKEGINIEEEYKRDPNEVNQLIQVILASTLPYDLQWFDFSPELKLKLKKWEPRKSKWEIVLNGEVDSTIQNYVKFTTKRREAFLARNKPSDYDINKDVFQFVVDPEYGPYLHEIMKGNRIEDSPSIDKQRLKDLCNQFDLAYSEYSIFGNVSPKVTTNQSQSFSDSIILQSYGKLRKDLASHIHNIDKDDAVWKRVYQYLFCSSIENLFIVVLKMDSRLNR